MLLEDLKLLVNELKQIPIYEILSIKVELLGIQTGIVNHYPFKTAAIKAFKCDTTVIRVNRSKLYKARYKIK